jgi:hypothetical protein
VKCARCDFVTDPKAEERPREQLEGHAEGAAHPLCGCCGLSLGWDEQGTCETPRAGRNGAPDVPSCLARARDLLAGVVTMYFEDLPQQLGQLRGSSYDSDRPGAADGRPLPGGDALVLLGPGSEGLAEDGFTTRKNDDDSSVAFDLAFWERTWREARSDPRGQSHRPKVQVRQASSYLEVHARWAARNHPGFPDYLDDLRLLHDRLERATGRHQRLVRAEAECFGCGADALVRQSRPAGQCEHEQPSQELVTVVPFKTETPRQRDERLQAWANSHSRCEQGGFENHWTCQRCGETYDWPRYLLALSGRLQESDVPGWPTPEQAAHILGVNAKTVRTWCTRLLVKTACVVGDQRMRVWLEDARPRAEKLHEDARRRAGTQSLETAREAS